MIEYSSSDFYDIIAENDDGEELRIQRSHGARVSLDVDDGIERVASMVFDDMHDLRDFAERLLAYAQDTIITG